jgi:hypothetical protein
MDNASSNTTSITNNHSFRRLFQLDVSKHVEKKGQFSYLSWPFAVAQLRLADPEASWEVRRFDGLPYLNTDLGFFVEVAVTVQGVTLSQIHPVLDNKNRPILAPSAFDINTSIQRCLVKAIALHGLGLSIYAGEDLPDLDEAAPERTESRKPASVTTLPKADSFDAPEPLATEAQKKFVQRLLKETGTDLVQLLEYFGFASIDAIPKAEVNRVIKALESKRRAA